MSAERYDLNIEQPRILNDLADIYKLYIHNKNDYEGASYSWSWCSVLVK